MLRCRASLLGALFLLTFLLSLPASAQLGPVDEDDEALLTRMSEDFLAALNDKDTFALDGMITDGALMVFDAPEGAIVLTKEEFLRGPMGLQALPEGGVQAEMEELMIAGTLAMGFGEMSAAGETAPAAVVAVKVENEWKLAAIMGLMGEVQPDVPADVADILDDIKTDGATGMQAALEYLPDTPCLAILGLPGNPMIMSGADAIRQTVGMWDAPETTEVTDEGETMGGASIAGGIFSTTVTTGNNELSLLNLVALVKDGAEWKVVVFAAGATGMEALEVEEDGEEEGDEEVEAVAAV